MLRASMAQVATHMEWRRRTRYEELREMVATRVQIVYRQKLAAERFSGIIIEARYRPAPLT